MIVLRFARFILYPALLALLALPLAAQDSTAPTRLPNGRLLGEVPGHPRDINNLPTAAAVSPDGRFVVFLHSGFGAYTAKGQQSLSVLNVETNELTDFPDDRLGHNARQTYFLGLAFASTENISTPRWPRTPIRSARRKVSTGNGIAVYSFEDGKIAPEKFLPLSPRTSLPARQSPPRRIQGRHLSGGSERRQSRRRRKYPGGLQQFRRSRPALNPSDGKIIHRFDLSTFKRIPASLPYTTVITNDGKRGFVSLWNASTVAELDLVRGKVRTQNRLGKTQHRSRRRFASQRRFCSIATTHCYLLRSPIATKSWLSTPATEKFLYSLFTKPAGQSYGGSDPQSLALSPDEKTLYSANAISDSVVVFDLIQPRSCGIHSHRVVSDRGRHDLQGLAHRQRQRTRLRSESRIQSATRTTAAPTILTCWA